MCACLLVGCKEMMMAGKTGKWRMGLGGICCVFRIRVFGVVYRVGLSGDRSETKALGFEEGAVCVVGIGCHTQKDKRKLYMYITKRIPGAQSSDQQKRTASHYNRACK